jgi:hypothetical protein
VSIRTNKPNESDAAAGEILRVANDNPDNDGGGKANG